MATLLAIRKRRFKAALALAGITQTQFGKRVGVTQTYVSKILSGKHASLRIELAIEAFTKKHLRPVVGTAPIVAASTITGNGQFSPEQPAEQPVEQPVEQSA